MIQRRRTQIRLAQRAYRQRKETTISGLNGRVASLEKTVDDMHKAFLEFNERAIASGIQKGAPVLAGYLKSTAERLSELAKNSTEESDIEEDENDPRRSVQPVAAEPRSRRQGRELGPEPASMLGYQTTFGEEEDEEEEDAGEIAALPAQFELDNNLPLLDWTGTENMQQLRSKSPKSNTQSRRNNNIRTAQQKWVDVLDDNTEQFLRSKGLYLDGHDSIAFGPIDASPGSEETPLPALSFSYPSPSLNGSGGPYTPPHTPPHTPKSKHAHWRNEPCSSGNHVFWNETMKVSENSDMGMNDWFDDASIRL